MGIQLMKLNETIGRIIRVRIIPKMFKNHARRSPCGKWDKCMKYNLKESKDYSKSLSD
jgi:U3 small nucleolar ribonucleoprotein component